MTAWYALLCPSAETHRRKAASLRPGPVTAAAAATTKHCRSTAPLLLCCPAQQIYLESWRCASVTHCGGC